jgi:hypothetical protein
MTSVSFREGYLSSLRKDGWRHDKTASMRVTQPIKP